MFRSFLLLALASCMTSAYASPVLNNVTSLQNTVSDPSTINARLYTPDTIRGIEVDQNGDLYFSDISANKVFKVNRAMRTSLYAGTGYTTNLNTTPQSITRPSIVFSDNNNRFIFEDSYNYYSDLLKLNKTTNRWETQVTGPGGVLYQILDSYAINNTVYFSNGYSSYDRQLSRINESGVIETVLGKGTVALPTDGSSINGVDAAFSADITGISGDGQGTIYFAHNNRIYSWNTASDVLTHIYGNGTNSIINSALILQSGGRYISDLEYSASTNTLYFIEGQIDVVAAINLDTETVSIIAGNGANSTIDGTSPLDANFISPSDLEVAPTGEIFIQDGNSTIYVLAEDTDNDLVNDWVDQFPADANNQYDYDYDGQSNTVDTDDDNDGLSDTDETTLGTNPFSPDSDNDGFNDLIDQFPTDSLEALDSDGDGVGDNSDALPYDGTETTDFDSDGIGDVADPDDDNDGTPDVSDAFPFDPAEDTDTDGDGTGDNADAFPNDATETTDADGDGVGANADTNDFNASVTIDTDGDGYADEVDAFINDVTEHADADNDGTGDNADTDDDNDGTDDSADAFPLDATEQVDADSDGFGDNKDADPNDPTAFFDINNNNVVDKEELKVNPLLGPDYSGLTAFKSFMEEDDLTIVSNGTQLAAFGYEEGIFHILDQNGSWTDYDIFATDTFLNDNGIDFYNVNSLAFGPGNTIYFSDYSGNVFQWIIGSTVTPLISYSSYTSPYKPDDTTADRITNDLYATQNGDLYVSYSDVIYRLNASNSTYTPIAGVPGSVLSDTGLTTADGVNALTAAISADQIAVSESGQVFWSEPVTEGLHAVRTIDADGNLLTLVSHPDELIPVVSEVPVAPENVAPRSFRLYRINDMHFANGELFISDNYWYIIALRTSDNRFRGVVGFGSEYKFYESELQTLGTPARSSGIQPEYSLTYFNNALHFVFYYNGQYTLGLVTEDGILSALNNWGSFTETVTTQSLSNFNLDKNGVLYGSDRYNIYAYENGAWVRKAGGGSSTVDTDGVTPLQASIGSIGSQAFDFDSQNRLVIADSGRYLIYRLETDGLLHRIAGTNGSYGNTDSSDALTGLLGRNLYHLTIDSLDQVVFYDYYARTIRRINSDGSLSTIAGKGNQNPANIDGQPSENVAAINNLSFMGVLSDGRIVIDSSYDFIITPDGLVAPKLAPALSSTITSVFERDGRIYLTSLGNVHVQNDLGEFTPYGNQGTPVSGDLFSQFSGNWNKIMSHNGVMFAQYDSDIYIIDFDQDNDGWVSYLDMDDNDPNVNGDIDGDGTEDKLDDDIDGDGVNNDNDLLPTVYGFSTDTDGDSIPDDMDADDDNDRIYDYQDPTPLIADQTMDSDGDGYADRIDAFPNDPTEYRDSDNDGLGDNADPDDDNDGVNDSEDISPLDASVSAQSSGSSGGGSVSIFFLLGLFGLTALRIRHRKH